MLQAEKEAYDAQTLQITDYRKQMEESKSNRLRDMEIATKQANLQQIEEKVYRDQQERQLETLEKNNHIGYITGHDFYTENTVPIK